MNEYLIALSNIPVYPIHLSYENQDYTTLILLMLIVITNYLVYFSEHFNNKTSLILKHSSKSILLNKLFYIFLVIRLVYLYFSVYGFDDTALTRIDFFCLFLLSLLFWQVSDYFENDLRQASKHSLRSSFILGIVQRVGISEKLFIGWRIYIFLVLGYFMKEILYFSFINGINKNSTYI